MGTHNMFLWRNMTYEVLLMSTHNICFFFLWRNKTNIYLDNPLIYSYGQYLMHFTI